MWGYNEGTINGLAGDDMGALEDYKNSVMKDYDGQPGWQPEYERKGGHALEAPMFSPDDLIGSGLAKLLAAALGPLGLMALKGGAKAGTNAAMRGQAGVIGKHHTDVINSMSRDVPDHIVDSTFGINGNVYYTPLRPFENSQATAIGGKFVPVGERLFATESPLTAKQMAAIEAMPLSPDATRAFAKELADEGLVGMLHKDKKRFGVVLPSTKETGVQFTEYDPKGAIGDMQFGTNAEAVQEMLQKGYSKYLPEDMLSRLIDKAMLQK